MSSNKFRFGLREVVDVFFLLEKIVPFFLKEVLPYQRYAAAFSLFPILALFCLVLCYYFPQREIFVTTQGYKKAIPQYRIGVGTVMASLAVTLPSVLLWLKWFKPDIVWLLDPDSLFWFITVMTFLYAIILLLSHRFSGRLLIVIALWIILSLCGFLLFYFVGFYFPIPYIVLLSFFIIYTVVIEIALGKETDTPGRR